MTITYPLAAPSIIYPASVTLTASSSQSSSQSPFTNARQFYDWQAEAWQLDVQMPPLTQEEADEWVSWALKLRGMTGTFLFGDPTRYSPLGVGTGTPQVNGASQTGFELATKGWTISTSKIMKKGDYFQLGSGSSARLYRLTSDADSDGSGHATLEFWPRLRISPLDSDALTVQNPLGVFRMATPNVVWNARSIVEFGFNFTAMDEIDVA